MTFLIYWKILIPQSVLQASGKHQVLHKLDNYMQGAKKKFSLI